MNHKIGSLAILPFLLLITPNSIQAQSSWFNINLNCYVNQGNAVCQIFNSGNMPMLCEINARGFFFNGIYLYSDISQWVRPGRNLYAYVYTQNPNRPFISAVGRGRCRY